jgi:tRNA pseudouridine38-40 synthase
MPDSRRYKLTISYRGTRYHGWQFQIPASTWKGEIPPPGHGLPTIQSELTRALAGVLNHPVTIHGSSRTDAGVHAKGQIAHFDTFRTQVPLDGLRRAVNHRLPDDILVRSIEPVPNEFDAIRCTTSKRYQYFIWHDEDRSPFFGELCWHRWQPLDVDAMKRAAANFAGTHDFASFARPGHGRDSTIRTVLAASVAYRKPRLVFSVEGTGFLWNMVRIMVGTLVEVGLGRYPAERIKEMLDAKDRTAAGPTAPPHGLYLQWIKATDFPAPSDFRLTDSISPPPAPTSHPSSHN